MRIIVSIRYAIIVTMEKLNHNSTSDGASKDKNEVASDGQLSGWDEVAAMADKMSPKDSLEAKKLEHTMADARDYFDYARRERARNQRVQESVEQELNSKLLTTEQLELEILDDNPDVTKDLIDFEETNITVYNLHGIPFSILSTTIDYRKGSHHTGSQTYLEVMEHPEMWAERRDQAESSSSFGTTNQDARGDTVSASYYNSESNFDNHVSGELKYGFDHVDADSIISITNSDGSTANNIGRGDTRLNMGSLDIIKSLEGPGGDGVYNEVCMRRYSENGFPKKPNYIIVEDGKITDVVKRHAKFFGIPIINIDTNAYHEKMLARGEAILESINESDSYTDIDQKYSKLYSMSVYHGRENRPPLEIVDVGSGLSPPQFDTYVGRKNKDTIELELSKRLELIQIALQKAKNSYESAINSSSRYCAENVFPDFDFFRIRLQDVSHENGWYEGNNHYHTDVTKKPEPGDCNRIVVEFRLKNSPRTVKTVIHDGERRFMADEALSRAYITPEVLSDANSGVYDTMAPLVRQYFDTQYSYKHL